MQQNKSRQSEAGNVFLFILLGIVLFAALSFTVARGFRGNTTGKMTERKADLAATEILNYAQRIERAVNKVRRNNCSENDISFTGAPNFYNNSALYNHTPQVDTKCRIFHPDGGGITPIDTRNSNFHIGGTTVEPHTTYMFQAQMRVTDIGTNTVGSGADLLIWLANIDENICLSVNEKLGIDNPSNAPPRDSADNAFDGFGFSGTYGSALNQIDAPELIGQPSGCFVSNINSETEDRYYFYSVLLAR
jgi:hypothetical protein